MASAKTGGDAKADNDIVNAFKLDTNQVFQKDRNVRCAPDTGQWFFHHPEYESFRAAKGLQLLFVTAEAGGGKSTVMRTLVDRLQDSDAPRSVVAYFFFKDDDDQLRSYEDALSSMIYQLFIQERGLIKHARNLYKQYGHGIRYQTKELWTILLAAATETHRELVCVLDAADECAPAGRRQLVSDLAVAFKSGANRTTKLKFVVTSRPYQDENHPYANLIASDTIRHLAGEDARVQSDIQSIIRFKAEELAKKYRLAQNTLDILVEAISSQNLQTRSFMAVRMAFELLDSHDLMHEGAGEDIIRAILADIPQTLGDQFDKMLDRSLDKEHARRLFCVILAARKTLRIPELKVLYALTQPRDPTAEPPQSYADLQLPADDDEFKRLIRAQCGSFITFVRSSVHLFHQTAREYLMANLNTTNTDSPEGKLMPTTSNSIAGREKDLQRTWRGCITKSDANLIMLTACMDLFNFKIPKSWVLQV
ncbi:hypothetical protein P171DRAFT_363088 [Karstenula rhodostoma CBS 690.94]|uniref:Nephrocystin 3-like N-terminal domain-containing protein n=1 Tax=Karstenula rhodostoma CBS 690.94 TaxID=1392251 RepID=A0A9P4PF05_9PLEO|nr:hypothetical protein P171DRAFT_363088 [Karstenula rhodostoma CBS 690.94]